MSEKIPVANAAEMAIPSLPGKAAEALALVNDPYTIEPGRRRGAKATRYKGMVRRYGLLLIWLHKHFYFGLWLLSHLRLSVYDSAAEAIDAFVRIHPEDQKVLCLPRSVFAATLSRRFKRQGVMFIAAFLPSRHMHAFIIEDGANPCPFDTGWTNYTPIALMS